MSAQRYMRVVSLWIHPGQVLAFEAFERDAARIMARHGGRIDQAARVTGQGADAPFEVHVVSFPDRAAADSYALDPATLEMKARRASIIARTEVLEGSEAGPYSVVRGAEISQEPRFPEILHPCGSSSQTRA